MQVKVLFYIASVVFAWSLSAPVRAAEKPEWRSWPNGDRLVLRVGYYRPALDTVVAARSADIVEPATRIIFERDLGLADTKGVAQLGLLWRISKRNALRMSYFELNRSGADRSAVDIRFGDNTFQANLPVQSFFDIRALDLGYSYSILMDPKKMLSVGIGVSVQELAFGLEGTADIPDPPPAPLPPDLPRVSERIDVTAPLPTLDARFSYAFTDKWLLDARAGWLDLALDLSDNEDIEGRVLTGEVGVRYKAFRNMGVFLNFSAFDVKVDYRKRSLEARLEYDYFGPVLGLDIFF